MKNIYTAKVNIQGVEGIVGGSSAEDLAQGVQACTEAIEQEIAKAKARANARGGIKAVSARQARQSYPASAFMELLTAAASAYDDDEDEDDYEDEDDCDCCDGRDCCDCPYC